MGLVCMIQPAHQRSFVKINKKQMYVICTGAESALSVGPTSNGGSVNNDGERQEQGWT